MELLTQSAAAFRALVRMYEKLARGEHVPLGERATIIQRVLRRHFIYEFQDPERRLRAGAKLIEVSGVIESVAAWTKSGQSGTVVGLQTNVHLAHQTRPAAISIWMPPAECAEPQFNLLFEGELANEGGSGIVILLP